MRWLTRLAVTLAILVVGCSDGKDSESLTFVGRGRETLDMRCQWPAGPEVVLPELDETTGYIAQAEVCTADPDPMSLRSDDGARATRGSGAAMWAPVGIVDPNYECPVSEELGVSQWLHLKVTLEPKPQPRAIDVENGASYLLTPAELWTLTDDCEVMIGTWELAPGSSSSPLGTSGTFIKQTDVVQVTYVLQRTE